MNILLCPKCEQPLEVNQEWRLVKPWKRGTEIKAGESIQGDYAHKDCREAYTRE